MEPTATIRINLAPLVALKSKRDGGEPITIDQLVRETGIARNTIKRYMRSGKGGFNGENIGTLCRYLGCEIEDLLKVVDIDEADEGESADTEDQSPLE